jgi:two-component system chemotaxis response regulator CheB
MGIKKVLDQNLAEIRLKINSSCGLLVYNDSENNFKCLYIDSFHSTDFSKLKKVSGIDTVKFIGGQEIFSGIKKIDLSWPEFTNTHLVENEIEVLVCFSSKKIKFSRVEIVPKEDDVLKNKTQAKKKVLIVDDSKTIQKILTRIVKTSPHLEVIGIADRPSVAKEMIKRLKPDIITLDIHMPEMTGVEFLKTYLCHTKIPTIMISSVSINDGPLVMEALSNGAATYIQKPSADKISEITPEIVSKLESIALSRNACTRANMKNIKKEKIKFESTNGLIVIGSSTGGTQALEEIFTDLPNEIPPIVVTQHIPAVFSKALADRLNNLCPFTIKEAQDGEPIQQNHIYIAPGGKQLKLKRVGHQILAVITDDPPVNRFIPSVDYLFDSVPALKERHVAGVILTGMGKDGAQGLLKLKDAGAYTIAQDEETSVVFGMPREAIEIGAACEISPLGNIAGYLANYFNQKVKIKKAV